MSNDLTLVSYDPQEILSGLLGSIESATGETLYAGDARRIFSEQETQALVAVYAKINDTGRQALLRYARGEMLDALGEFSDTPRLQPTTAGCRVEFTASPGHPAVTIPAGTRVSPDGVLFFCTVFPVIIDVGVNTGQTSLMAMGTGAKYNGFAPGQISLIVDPQPYLASVANITTSAGGADMEADGSSEPPYSDYRARIRMAPLRYSAAGPRDSYIYWAKTASANIASVTATSPSAAEIVLTVLMADGAPSPDILAAVQAACSDRTRRPLGDHVTAQGPDFVDFTIEFSYTINAAYAAYESSIRTAIEGAGGAVEQYVKWQTSEIGRAVTPSQLLRYIYGAGSFDDATRMMLSLGVGGVMITSPVAAAVTDTQAAFLSGAPEITYGGAV